MIEPKAKWWGLVFFAVVAAAILLLACQPIPRTIPPGLERWAAEKAKRLATCVAAGHRGQAILRCLADYAPDRGTYACERAARAVTGDPDG